MVRAVTPTRLKQHFLTLIARFTEYKVVEMVIAASATHQSRVGVEVYSLLL